MNLRIVRGLALVSPLFLAGLLLLPGWSQTRPTRFSPALTSPIVMWSGTLAEIPAGWQFCDGTNGTPDLCDRFVQGVQSGQAPGETGGAHEIQLTGDNLPAHGHSFQTGTGGSHYHQFFDTINAPYMMYWGGLTLGDACNASYEFITRTSSASGDHVHAGVTDPAGTAQPIENRPAFYRLAFITSPSGTPSPTHAVTKGAIIMWAGAQSTIPAGWQLCDGTNGPPDLRDRFVLGVQQGQDPGEVAGSDTIQLMAENLPAHQHAFQTDPGGAHSHTYPDAWLQHEAIWAGILPWDNLAWAGDVLEYETTSDDGTHTHSGVTGLEGNATFVDNRPAYYSLAFITKN